MRTVNWHHHSQGGLFGYEAEKELTREEMSLYVQRKPADALIHYNEESRCYYVSIQGKEVFYEAASEEAAIRRAELLLMLLDQRRQVLCVLDENIRTYGFPLEERV